MAFAGFIATVVLAFALIFVTLRCVYYRTEAESWKRSAQEWRKVARREYPEREHS